MIRRRRKTRRRLSSSGPPSEEEGYYPCSQSAQKYTEYYVPAVRILLAINVSAAPSVGITNQVLSQISGLIQDLAVASIRL